IEIVPIGDVAIQVICKYERIHEIVTNITNANIVGVSELVPGYQSVTIYYDPLILSYRQIYQSIYEICSMNYTNESLHVKEIVHIPTCYEGDFGIDLNRVASLHNITIDEVIRLHSNQEYYVRMIGFLPGFPYLQG